MVSLVGNNELDIELLYCQSFSLRSDHNLVVALAISDACFGIAGLERAAGFFIPFCSLTMFQCAFQQIPVRVSQSSKYLVVLSLSLFRLLGVEYPVKCKRLVEKKAHLWFYAGVTLCTVAFCLTPIIYKWRSNERAQICTIGYLIEVRAVTYMTLLSLLTCAANLRLYILMRRKSIEIVNNPAAAKAARMSKTLILTSVAFVMTTASSALIYALTRAFPVNVLVMVPINGVAAMTSSFVNFFLYWFRLPEFRRSILKRDVVTPVSIRPHTRY